MPFLEIQQDDGAYWSGVSDRMEVDGDTGDALTAAWYAERSSPTVWGKRWRVAAWHDTNASSADMYWKNGPNLSGYPDPDVVLDGDTIAYDRVAGTGEKCLTVAAGWDEFDVGEFLVGGDTELYVVVEPYPAAHDGWVFVRKYAATALDRDTIITLYATNKLGDWGYGFFCFDAPEKPYHKVVAFL